MMSRIEVRGSSPSTPEGVVPVISPPIRR
jgi:hypothetical protein